MTGFLKSLSSTRALWVSFIATVLISIAFLVVMAHWNFLLIDELSNAEVIRTHIAALSDTQKQVHILATATLDVLYPFAYASLFIGLAIRFYPNWGMALALRSVLVVPVDLSEGVVQVLLLGGHDNFVWLKTIFTPLKLVLFLSGLAIALSSLWLVTKRKFFA